MKVRLVILNQLNFAKRGEFSKDITVFGPRLSIISSFSGENNETSGEFQIMISDYTFQFNIQAKVINNTGEFDHLRFTSLKFNPIVREFNAKLSNTAPESHGKVTLIIPV
jgi:hypothetical protein